jgi:hypothetical protein
MLKELCTTLSVIEDREFYLFANIRVPNAQIDLVILTDSSIYLVELKNSAGLKVTGGLNGKWVRSDGKELGTWVKSNDKERGRGNPIDQLLLQYRSFREWLRVNQERYLLGDQVVGLVGTPDETFKDIKKFIVLYPFRHPDTSVGIGEEYRLTPFLGDVIGFDELAKRLTDPIWECRIGINLELENINRICNLLRLTPVNVNELIGSGLSNELPSPIAVLERPKKKSKLMWPIIAGSVVVGLAAIFIFLSLLGNSNLCNKALSIQEISEREIGQEVVVKIVARQISNPVPDGKTAWDVYLNDHDTDFAVRIGTFAQRPDDQVLRFFDGIQGKAIAVSGIVENDGRANFDKRVTVTVDKMASSIMRCG